MNRKRLRDMDDTELLDGFIRAICDMPVFPPAKFLDECERFRREIARRLARARK